MKQIKRAYDPLGTLDLLWKGGYKLPKDEDTDPENHRHREL
jgi:hypothetical protein